MSRVWCRLTMLPNVRDDARRAIAALLGGIAVVAATFAAVVVTSQVLFFFCVALACAAVTLAVIVEVPDIKVLMSGRQPELGGGQSRAVLPVDYPAPAPPKDLTAAIAYIPFTSPVKHVLDVASARAELDSRRFLTVDLLLQTSSSR